MIGSAEIEAMEKHPEDFQPAPVKRSCTKDTKAKFKNVWCSSCGEDFGPGDSGFSHCESHKGMRPIG